MRSLTGPVVLIAGGTDKNIDFSPLAEVARAPCAILLLAGTGTEKIRALLEAQGVSYEGPFTDLAEAVRTAIARAISAAAGGISDAAAAGGISDAAAAGGISAAGTGHASVLFSPGCTSFGMFLNEFDRGRRFKDSVRALASP